MKKLNIIIALMVCFTTGAFAQTVNWQALPTKGHLFSVNVGWDYSFSWGVGYGYKLNTKFPIILKADVSVPSGEEALDDFNVKLGAQIQWFKRGSFCFSTETDGIFRRYENDYARILNFGSYTTAVAGIYKPK